MFHSTPWLKALHQTYGYPVIAYTTSAPGGEIENAVVFCRIKSWLTGRRLVSLPFSDHCEPLVNRPEDFQTLLAAVEEDMRRETWHYAEIRPLKPIAVESAQHSATLSYHLFELDLQPDLETIFGHLHKDCIQRKILRAQREKLCYEEGRADSLVDEFYRLLTLTRRRHLLPPQPRKWFENLRNCFGEALKIRIARKEGRPLAGMLTLKYKDTLTYKYGASDSRYKNLGSMHLLYWTAIQEAKALGLRCFDLGRTDTDQPGLITFKKRWGARGSRLTYSRYFLSNDANHILHTSTSQENPSVAREVLGYLPNRLLCFIGGALYKHVG